MGFDTSLTRSELLRAATGLSVLGWLGAASQAIAQPAAGPTTDELKALERWLGLEFSDAERKAALVEVRSNLQASAKLDIPYDVAPSLIQRPIGREPAASTAVDVRPSRSLKKRPSTDEDVAFLTVSELASLIKSKQITPTQLTEIYLARCRKYDAQLNCVVTLCEDSARREAAEATAEIAAGRYRGPLHGIPYGIKDLFSAKGYPTTWGAEPFQNQVIDEDAAVVERLRAAGAIMIAKLSLGALAMDDKWFRGQIKNPWNLAQGSSGSSAGPGSAMASALCAFTIGTETLGSIVSPSQRCRVTGLRPTFGRISRRGAMALSWSMDKVGPMCRTAEDCLLVLAALVGHDPADLATVDRPLRQRRGFDPKRLKIAILDDGKPLDEDDANSPIWSKPLAALGLKPERIKISPPHPSTLIGLSVEAAAAFDTITRTGEVNKLTYSLWPQIFRAHRYFTAVEYIQSLRMRTMAQEKFEEELGDFDLVVAPDRGAQLLLVTNLTGHPQLYMPVGMDGNRSIGMSIVGRLYEEATLCAFGNSIQSVTVEWRKRPPLFTSS